MWSREYSWGSLKIGIEKGSGLIEIRHQYNLSRTKELLQRKDRIIREETYTEKSLNIWVTLSYIRSKSKYKRVELGIFFVSIIYMTSLLYNECWGNFGTWSHPTGNRRILSVDYFYVNFRLREVNKYPFYQR